MSLYIGVTTAASELVDSAINAAITRLAAAAAGAARRGLIPNGPSLDVVFMLPGKREKPDFAGMRMGGYTRERNTLYFEVSVPERVLKSAQADQYVAAVMEDVLTNAEEFFTEHAVDFAGPPWQRLVKQLVEQLTEAA